MTSVRVSCDCFSLVFQENILPQLMNVAPSSCEELFKRELAKYDPVVADVQSNIVAQQRLLEEIKVTGHAEQAGKCGRR